MLKMNLATRPFYNDRAVHLVLAGLGLAVIVVLAFGSTRLVELSRTHRALTLAADEAELEAAAVSTQTARLERGMSRDALAALALAAEEGNRLIEQRLFSWTAFFNVIEQTLPANVMLTAVRPDAEAGGTSVDPRGDRTQRRRHRGVHRKTRSDRRLRGRAGPAG